MKRAFLLVVGTALLLSAACGPKHSIVGTWTGSNLPGAPAGSTAEITYSEPDKMHMAIVVQQVAAGKDFKLSMNVDGTYKLQGSTLKHQVTSVDFKVEGLDETTTKRVMEALEPQKAKLKDDLNKEPDQRIEWKDKDQVLFKGAKGDTLFRKK